MTGLWHWLRALLRRPGVSTPAGSWRELAERIFP
jgi:hypothetical protein